MAGTDRGGRGANDPGRRPTKAERREDARREREQIQRQMARRRRNRSVGLILIVVAVVVVVVAVFVTSGGGGSGNASAADLLKQAAAAEKSAGCTAVQTTPNYQNAPGADPDIDHAHIGTAPVQTAPPLSSYATTPPASGPHDPVPLPAGIYPSPPSVYSTIHSLEHGGVIVWYAAGASGSQLDQLKAFYRQSSSSADVGQDRVIVAPYDYPDQGAAGQLPSGVQMALVSWHRLETCSSVSLAAAFDFTSQYEVPVYDHRTSKGVPREPGLPL